MKVEYSKERCMQMSQREEVESALEIAAEGKGAAPLERTVRRFLLKRDVRGCYGRLFAAGSLIDYYPWPHEWQGKSESQRVLDGVFVHCYGQGEFDVFCKDDVADTYA